MTLEDFKDSPKRVWINNPSTLQPHHKLHGRVGIGVYKKHKAGAEEVSVYFTEGELHSIMVNPIYLAKAVGR